MAKAHLGTVLIVEDDEGVADLERRRLERAGYAALSAATVETAMRALESSRIDLILLDYRLPGDVDGLDFYERMKSAGFDLPVILVTGFSNEATVIRALRVGVRDFVTKSTEYLDYLPEAVTRVLKQVHTEQQLAESEARLGAIIRSAQDAILIARNGQEVTLFNAAAERMFRCKAADAIGQPLAKFIPLDVTDPSADATLSARIGMGTRGVRADGEEFPLEASVSRAEVGGVRFHTVVVRDVSERRRLEAQLHQAQRMEGIGVLAGGVAHDFNNLLTVINGYTDMVLDEIPPDAPWREMLGEIRQAGERAAALTRQLLAFGRKQVLAPQVIDLNVLVRETERLLRRLIGADIDLASSLAPDAGRVKVDPGQFEQVLMNLAINSRDAMPAGGHLTIETRNVQLSAADVGGLADVRPGPFVMLAVSDSGVGMTEAVKARIFEPFYTTKPIGKGTGLGLSTVYGIVKQSLGHIEVYSEPGHGTTFKVYLPRADEAATPMSSPARFSVPRGTETILLAEDEDGVRALARLALLASGYDVLEARDGEAALAVSRGHDGPIHLLLTDVVMPKLGGRQLADALTGERPGVRVLFLSGYTGDAIVRHGVLESGTEFLQKPFTPLALARKVRDVLDR
jgi:PAS domain S-box-containing protein